MEVLVGFTVAAIAAYFIYEDAEARGMNKVGWSIGTFLVMLPVVIVYLIFRKDKIQSI